MDSRAGSCVENAEADRGESDGGSYEIDHRALQVRDPYSDCGFAGRDSFAHANITPHFGADACSRNEPC